MLMWKHCGTLPCQIRHGDDEDQQDEDSCSHSVHPRLELPVCTKTHKHTVLDYSEAKLSDIKKISREQDVEIFILLHLGQKHST